MLRIVEVGENLFYFRFTTEEWMNKVMSGGPWNFDNHILLLQQWREGMVETSIVFSHIDIWSSYMDSHSSM